MLITVLTDLNEMMNILVLRRRTYFYGICLYVRQKPPLREALDKDTMKSTKIHILALQGTWNKPNI